MRIGFDGKRAVQNFTGLGNYSRYIVDILCQFYPENEYVLYAPKKRENKRLDKLIEAVSATTAFLSHYFFLEKVKFIVASMGRYPTTGKRKNRYIPRT